MRPNILRAEPWRDAGISVRTCNEAEVTVCAALERDGWTVMKRGWPDFLAVRGDEVRFIEVKPAQARGRRPHLKPAQRKVAAILARFGITVEVVTPDDVHHLVRPDACHAERRAAGRDERLMPRAD